MVRFFTAIVVLIVLALAAVAGVWLFGSRAVAADQLAREVTATVAWAQEPITVTARIDLLPYSSCGEQATPIDLVVLLDVSGSMEGEPLVQAVAGAERLLDMLDLTHDQAAIALFNNEVVGHTAFTNDRQMLRALLQSAVADGGTEIAAGLDSAHSELVGLRRRYDALPVIVLFSDGGSEDEAAARTMAEAVKESGARVYVVGLQSVDFNQPLLATIASDPDALKVASDSAGLVGLFEEIAQAVNQYVIAGLSYAEPVATQQFAIVTASLPDNVTANANGLALNAGLLTAEQAQALSGFTYQVVPQQFGYHAVTARNASLSFVACGAERVQRALPPGPAVLVLPPLPFTLGIPFLLLLLGGLPLLFRGRKPRPQTPPVVVGPPPKTPDNAGEAPALGAFAEWLGRAASLDPAAGRNEGASLTTTPTLIVGLGSSGRTVLAQIAANLNDRIGEQWPAKITLLQVSLPASIDPGAEGQLPKQVTEVVLANDIRRLRIDLPHLQWAHDHAGGVRQSGRMALFSDLARGKDESLLWGPLGRALANQTGLMVWIVADAFGPASGMIADICHLLRVRAQTGIIGGIQLCLALQNARWPGGQSAALAQRSYATLRELRRVRKMSGARFAYAPELGQPELDAVNAGKLYDEIYLFDGVGENRNNATYDISALPPAEGVLRVISNSLLALLEQSLSQVFYERERNAQTELVRGGEHDFENYGSSMGCATIRTPLEPTRRLVELRLVHSLLFDAGEGLFGWGKLSRDGQLTPLPVTAPAVGTQELDFFLRYTGLGPGETPDSPELRRRLASYLSDRMNDGSPLRLHWALAVLAAAHDGGVNSPLLDDVQAQLESWLALVGSRQPPAAGVRAGGRLGGASLLDFDLAPDAGAAALPPLVAQWQVRWTEARACFPRPADNAPEQLAWKLDQEIDLFERYFPTGDKSVERLRRRTYWLWSTAPRLELRLLVLPNLLTAPATPGAAATHAAELRSNPYRYALSVQEAPQLVERLLAAAAAFSRTIDQDVIALYVKEQSVRARLVRNASPLFVRVETGSERVAIQSQRYLLAPRNAPLQAEDVDAELLCVHSDPSCCAVLQAQHTVRLDNMKALADAERAYRLDPGLHVFQVEQWAVEREKAAERYGSRRSRILTLSPEAAARLEKDSAEFDQLGRLIVYGAVQLRAGAAEWLAATDVAALAALDGCPLAGLLTGFAALVKNDAAARAAVAQQLANGQLDHTQRAGLQVQIDALALSAGSAAQDMAICIAWALEKL